MSRYVHKIEISLVGIEHLSKENKEINYERRSQTRRELFFLVREPLTKRQAKNKEVTDEPTWRCHQNPFI